VGTTKHEERGAKRPQGTTPLGRVPKRHQIPGGPKAKGHTAHGSTGGSEEPPAGPEDTRGGRRAVFRVIGRKDQAHPTKSALLYHTRYLIELYYSYYTSAPARFGCY
jgi:hypothetical protein